MKSRIIFVVSIFTLLFMLACQAGNPIVALFATETPTPTMTFTPTPTFTPTITPSPTMTFTPTPVPETSIEQIADDLTLFTDYKGGYAMTFPDNWWVINLVVDNPVKTLEEAQDSMPELAAQLESMKLTLGLSPRMLALDTDPDHRGIASGPVSYNILQKDTSQTSLDEVLERTAEVLPQILNAKVKNGGIKENDQGLSYGVIDVTISVTSDGTSSSVYEKIVMFYSQNYTVAIYFVASEEYWDLALPAFEEIINSIRLLD